MERQARDPREQRGGSATRGDVSRRQTVEQRSEPLLLMLRRAPRWLVPLLPLALLLAGLAAPASVGGPALLALAVILGWLAFLSWPSLGHAGRLLRALALSLVLALAVLRLLGAF